MVHFKELTTTLVLLLLLLVYKINYFFLLFAFKCKTRCKVFSIGIKDLQKNMKLE